MDLNNIIRDLKAERDMLSVAIECLESLARGGGKRRGRPPAWLKADGRIPPDSPTRPKRHQLALSDHLTALRQPRAAVALEAVLEPVTEG